MFNRYYNYEIHQIQIYQRKNKDFLPFSRYFQKQSW